MSTDRRNPYLVLGVPYGASREQATTAFAKRTRRARRETSFPYTVDDLTWALNQVEAGIANPTADVSTFRVPADPEVVAPPSGNGVLSMEPVRMPRTTAPASELELEVLRVAALREALILVVMEAAPHVGRKYGLGAPPPAIEIEGSPQLPRPTI